MSGFAAPGENVFVFWSFRIATLFGIPLRVHFTFVLLLPFVAAGALSGMGIPGGFSGLFLIFVLFASVVLHELGHSLVARAYRIPVRDIVLLPIGGVASIAGMPRYAHQELLIALAGPAVSFALGFGALVVVLLTQSALPEDDPLSANLFVKLMLINIGLGTFNLVPAFPMDGGRVLRSFLALCFSHQLATTIAVTLGRIVAVLGLVVGVAWQHPTLVLVSIFVYMGATAELRQARLRDALGQVAVRDAMVDRFVTIGPDWTLAHVVAQLGRQVQDDFPVVDGAGRLVGILSRPALARALREQRLDTPVAFVMDRRMLHVSPHATVADALQALQEHSQFVATVVENGRLVGLVGLPQIAGIWQRASGAALPLP